MPAREFDIVRAARAITLLGQMMEFQYNPEATFSDEQVKELSDAIEDLGLAWFPDKPALTLYESLQQKKNKAEAK